MDFNGTVTDVTLSLEDLDGGVDLVKWAWPAGLPKEPMWFRAFQAMSDPRKFDKFDDYRNFTTREWREETKTDRPEDFDRWKQEAVVGSEVHDAKKVTINRAVFVKILDMEYVFLAVQKEALSPLTNKMSRSNTIAAIVREDGELKCADIGKNCLVIADPRESGEIQKMIESSRAVISGGVLRSR